MESPSSKTKTIVPFLRFSPLTLKDIASTRCALVCWSIEIKNPNSQGVWGNEWFKERTRTLACKDILPAPAPAEIRPVIDHKIRLMGKDLENWMIDHQFLDFVSRDTLVSCIVLNPLGDICYKQTAENLLKLHNVFNIKEQFKIACKYSFEQEIKRLWPSVKDDAIFILAHSFNIDSRTGHVQSIDYWCSRMRGELQETYSFCGSTARSPEWYVISNRPGTTKWAETEYYWSKLNTNERNTLVRGTLTDRNFTKHLIFKWNDKSQIELCISQNILTNLAEDGHYDFALQVWNSVKNSITESTFLRIISKLLAIEFHGLREHGSRITTLIKDIWASTPRKLKNYICSSIDPVQHVLKMCTRFLDVRFFGRDISFLIELIRDITSMEIRNQIWLMWWRKLIAVAKVSDIIKLMTVCFKNKDDIAKFKRNIMLDCEILQEVSNEFIKNGFYNELADYLKFCNSS